MNTGALTRALCMALAHSVWQGLLAAVVAAIIIAATRRSRASIRYNLLMLDLLLFLLAAGTTFFRELGSGRVLPMALTGRQGGSGVAHVLAQLPVHAPVQGLHPVALLVRAGRLLNTHASIVVLIWMFCLLLQLVRMAGGLYRMRNLRTTRVFAAPEGWGERAAALAARLGITRPVVLLQSALVNMPVTFGYLKPVLLMPLGILANLPPDQVETILLHELAHIRRNDYLVNLLLCLTEAVFFFNPGVRWIATRMREEREACCDDMVLGGVRDRSSYLDALVAFREYAARSCEGYALALGSGKSDLLWRIRRMLNQENKKLHIMEKAILSIGLTVILTIGLISMRSVDRRWGSPKTKTVARTSATVVAVEIPEATDTVPGAEVIRKAKFPTINTNIEDNGTSKKVRINATDAEGNTFELTRVDGQVVSLVINGKTIPNESFGQYMYIFDEIARRSEHRGRRDAELTEDEVRQEVQDRQQEAWQKEQEDMQLKLEQAQRDQEVAQAKIEHDQDEAQEKAQQALEKIQEKAERDQEAREKDQEAQARVFERLYKENHMSEDAQNERSNAHILRDLIDNGLVGSKDEVKNFTLDNDGLTLNGVKQPDDVYKVFKKKYVWKPKDRFIYKHSATSSTSQVQLDDGKDNEQ